MAKDVVLKMDPLMTLAKILKNNEAVIQVGILGNKIAREGDETTNAEIGAKHEFGSPSEGLPVRSFLRMPLNYKLRSALDDSNILTSDNLKKLIRERSMFSVLDLIGATAIRVIDDAFASGGFGQWKPSNMAEKKVQMTLVETSQLRRSIDFRVKK